MSASLLSIKPTRSQWCLRPRGVKVIAEKVCSSGGIMIRNKSLRYALLLALGVFLATSGHAQQSQPAPQAAKPAKASKTAAAPRG